MGKKLFVGNLAWAAKNEDLENLFTKAGSVVSANIITDRESGRSRGFGFVEMDTEDEARQAMSDLDGADLCGRNIRVHEAQDKKR